MSKTYRGALLLALVIALLVPASAAAAVPAGVTKGLDYLRTRQRSDGGFSYSSSQGSAATTPWVMLAIASGANNPARWKSDGHSPITYLQSINLTSAATNSGNAPEYYALCIVAYRTANRTDLLTSAGSTQIDLVDKLESYQSLTGDFYSPSGSTFEATETTAWAILGLVAAHQSGPQLSGAVSWLEGQANTAGVDAGGFGSTPGPDEQSSTTVTSLVVQALAAAGASVTSGVVPDAIAFIERMQVSDGGFTDTSDGFVNAQSTGWAIEAMHAALRDPHALVVDGHSPFTFLASLRQKNGSYHDYPSDIGDVMGATTQASFALGGRTLGSAPAKNRVTRFAPSFKSGSIVPKPGARLASGTVWVEASYADNVNGTGIDAKAIRVTVERAPEDRGGPYHLVAPHARAHQARQRHVHVCHPGAGLGGQLGARRTQLHGRRAGERVGQHRRRHPPRWLRLEHRLGRQLRLERVGRHDHAQDGHADTHSDDLAGGEPGHHAEPHAFGRLPGRLPEPFTGRRHGADRRLEWPRRRWRRDGARRRSHARRARVARVLRLVGRAPSPRGRHGRGGQGRGPAARRHGLAAVLETFRRTPAGRRRGVTIPCT